MLRELPRGNLSLFPTNTDGCRFKRGLVLVKHDKVRDDTPSVTKVWRSSNASVVAPPPPLSFFFRPRQPLVHVSAANKAEESSGHAFGPVCWAEVDKWKAEGSDTSIAAVSLKHDLVWVIFSAFVSTTNFRNFVFKSPFDAVTTVHLNATIKT